MYIQYIKLHLAFRLRIGKFFLFFTKTIMFIKKMNLTKCETCNKLRGTIEEKHNGNVPVWCKCDFKNATHPRANPCAMCIGGEYTDTPIIIWRPISDSKDENGNLSHSSYFAGPSVW
jgi:hypothetical protein